MRYAVIENGAVVNIAVADMDFATAQGWIAAPDGCAIGWSHDGEVFAAPTTEPAPAPSSITRRQAKRALHAAGLLASAEAALAALPEPMRTAALIDWQDALTFERDNALIAAMATTLNLTSEQVDDLFRAAAGI